MSNHHVYKKVEVVGSSPNSIDDAIRVAIAECAKTIRYMEWFEVKGTRGHIANDQVAHFQVVLQVTGVQLFSTCQRSAMALSAAAASSLPLVTK